MLNEKHFDYNEGFFIQSAVIYNGREKIAKDIFVISNVEELDKYLN